MFRKVSNHESIERTEHMMVQYKHGRLLGEYVAHKTEQTISTRPSSCFVEVLSVPVQVDQYKKGAAVVVCDRLTRAVSLLRFMKLSSCSLRFRARETSPSLLSPSGQKMTLNLRHKASTW
jgi:hypothetical protein